MTAALGLTARGENLLSDGRTGKNTQHTMVAQMRQFIFSRLASYKDINGELFPRVGFIATI